MKPPKINYEPRNKMKGKGGAANLARNRKIVQGEAKKEFIKNMKQVRAEIQPGGKKKKIQGTGSVLDRFLPK